VVEPVAEQGVSREYGDMSPQRSVMTPAEIRSASPPKSLRGFDEAATQQLLDDVANTVQSLTVERDQLRRKVEEAKSAATDADDPTTIGNALLAAQRAGEQLVEHARETADRILAESQEEGERLREEARQSVAEHERRFEERRVELEQDHARLRQELGDLEATLETERQAAIAAARAEADELTGRSQQRLEALRLEEEAVRELIDKWRREFVGMLQSALDQVAQLHEVITDGGEEQRELAEVLTSRVGDGRGEHGTSSAGQDDVPSDPEQQAHASPPQA
jgi:cell division septum initiation protein DivIVA